MTEDYVVESKPPIAWLSPRFNRMVLNLIDMEGGYVNNPYDPGGETKYGITKHTYDAWLKVNSPTRLWPDHVKYIGKEHAATIYNNWYWISPEIAVLPDEFAYHTFVAGVNIGPYSAIKLMQRALRVADDGIIGNITFSTAMSRYEDSRGPTVLHFCRNLMNYYRRLPGWDRFGTGWENRIWKTLRTGHDT